MVDGVRHLNFDLVCVDRLQFFKLAAIVGKLLLLDVIAVQGSILDGRGHKGAFLSRFKVIDDFRLDEV